MENIQKNGVTASLTFDFRGQTFNPNISVDLDKMMSTQQDLNNLHDLLAASIGMDCYRHEYDILIMSEIIFTNPTGLACAFVSSGRLNFDDFKPAWEQQQIIISIQPIAHQHLDILDLTQHPKIQAALIESYKAGQKHQTNEVISPPESF